MGQEIKKLKFGLKEYEIEKINKVFESFPEIDEVLIYGSRAKGNFKEGSDIDMAIKGNRLTQRILNNISILIDDLLLPYICELSIYNRIKNPELTDHINRVGKVLYKKILM